MIPFIKRFSYLHLKNLDDLQPDETEVKGIVPSPRYNLRARAEEEFLGVSLTPPKRVTHFPRLEEGNVPINTSCVTPNDKLEPGYYKMDNKNKLNQFKLTGRCIKINTKINTIEINTKSRAVGSLVVRASDSRPEGLGSMPDATKHPPSTHESRCRNCGGGDRGRVAIYRPFGELRRAKIVLSPVRCSRPTTGVPLAHAPMNFVGLDLTASDRWHQKTTTTTLKAPINIF
ncbi:hypothetical protein TNCV_4381381 [Trichonephila clavipes]|nr:hypothetical protein TNCV_4381381 [Trichonephila clavipes]